MRRDRNWQLVEIHLLQGSNQMKKMRFAGVVESRSSLPQIGGPPGESDVLALNPERQQGILAATGWSTLYPGTLNLGVTDDVVHRLLLYKTIYAEDGFNIRYPEKYAYIPLKRIGYLYYSATISKEKDTEQVPILLRRACNPLNNRVEEFAERQLRQALDIQDGNVVYCTVG